MSDQDTMTAPPAPIPQGNSKRLYMAASTLHNAALTAYYGAVLTGQPHLIEAKRRDAIDTLEGQLDAQSVYLRHEHDF